jgi:quinol monooxygenase YgiN
MIYVVAHMQVKADKVAAFLDSVKPVLAATRAEAGCISYLLNVSIEDPAQFVFVEQWRDRADLDGHVKSAHMKTFAAALRDMLAGRPRVECITPEKVENL